MLDRAKIFVLEAKLLKVRGLSSRLLGYVALKIMPSRQNDGHLLLAVNLITKINQNLSHHLVIITYKI